MSVQARPNFLQYLWLCLLILSGIVAISVLQMPRLNNLKQDENLSPETAQKEVESSKASLNLLKKFPAFGFENLVADWVFIEFLEYFGDDEARQLTDYRLSPEYFEIIVDRDPRFLDIYPFLSASTSIYAGQPERSIKLIEQGLKSLNPHVQSRSYYVWRYKATDELLFLGDPQAARQSFQKAAEWASIHPDEESQQVAQVSRQTAQFLENNPDSKSAQVSAWGMVLQNAVDKETREAAVRRIEELGGKVTVSDEGIVNVQLPEQD